MNIFHCLKVFLVYKSTKIFIFLLMSIQLIDLTLNYRQYKTIIKTDIKYFTSGDLPSLTFCKRDHDWKFHNKSIVDENLIKYRFDYTNNQEMNITRGFSIQVSSSLTSSDSIKWFDSSYYSSMTDIIITNFSKPSLKCVTLFSKLQLKSNLKSSLNLKDKSLTINLLDDRYTAMYLSVHEPNRIVHSNSKNDLTNYYLFNYNLNVKTEHLLPPPFKTNCVNYIDNIGKKHLPKSLSECQKQCLAIGAKVDQLECKCEKDCTTETFYLDLMQTWMPLKKTKIKRTNIIVQRNDREEHFYHLPLMSLTDYLCSIGGIMAMWIGISIWSQAETILRILKNKYRAKYSKILKSIRWMSLEICIILSLTQTILTLKQYFSYEYVIRISSQVSLDFPSFQFHSLFYINSTLVHQFNEINNTERKMLVDNIINESIKVDCQIIFRDERIFCNQFYDKIQYYKWNEEDQAIAKLKIFERKPIDDRYFNWMSFEDKPRIKISVNYFRTSSDLEIKLVRGSFRETEQIWMLRNKVSNVKFNQRSFHFLESPYPTDCRYYNRSSQENEHKSQERCYQKCITDLERISQCFKEGFFLADQFFSMKLNSCQSNLDLENKIELCAYDCKPECHLNYYNFYADLIDNENLHNSSIMNIFPDEKPYLKYIYTPKMDFDQLVYNIGGICGLWFGLSAFSIMNFLVESVKKIYLKLGGYCSRCFRRNKVDVIRIETEMIKIRNRKGDLKRRISL